MKPDPQLPTVNPTVDGTIIAAIDADKINNTLRAYGEMKRRIIAGEMRAGDQFLEQELAAMLGMSRTPVREALIRLSDERLVEVRPRHGARVLPISAEDIADVYEITSELEAAAARRAAAGSPSDADIKAMEQACDRMEAATVDGNFLDWVENDNAFHEAVVRAGGNTRLTDIFTRLMEQVHRARRVTATGRSIPAISNTEHRALIAAIKSGNPDEAHRITHAHRMRSRTNLIDLLRRIPRSV